MTQTFLELGIRSEILLALTKLAIVDPSPIQSAAIPLILEGKDLYLQSETGTGKTLSYLLPIYSRIDPRESQAQALILAPTYELAIQIQRQCVDLSQHSGLSIKNILLIGGTSLDRQLEKLKNKPHIVVGTPGRVLDLIKARKLKTQALQTVVIDEADRMLCSESLTLLKDILKSLPLKQAIFVSATAKNEIIKLVESIVPKTILVKPTSSTVNADIEHVYIICESRDRVEITRKVIHALKESRSIIFVHKNQDAEILASKLAHHKLKVVDIHAALNKEDRKKAMDQLRAGKVDVLIASDLAARGLDVKGVTHVINYDLPSSSESYLHRVGRCGRAGSKGLALSLVSESQKYLIQRFNKDLRVQLAEVYLSRGEVFQKQE